MLGQVRNQLIEDIKENISSIDLVDKYRGEFVQGSEWNPRPTACFIQILGDKPFLKAADSSNLKFIGAFKIYAGANFKLGKDGVDVVEQVGAFLDNADLTVADKRFHLQMSNEGWDLIYYERGFEGYAFILLLYSSSSFEIFTPPDAPLLTSPANGSNSGLVKQIFEWQNAAGAVSYKIQVSPDNTFKNPIIAQGGLKNSSFTLPFDVSLLNNTTYYWRVSASNAGGESDWSTAWSFTVNEVDTDFAELLIRFPNVPTVGRQILMNQLIIDLKANNLWNKFDCFWMIAQETEENAKINWIKHSPNLTTVNAPIFTIDRGYQGNGVSSYVNTNFNPGKLGLNFIVNNQGTGYYSRTNSDGAQVDMGAYDGRYTSAYTRFGNITYFYVDSGSGGNIANNNSQGLFVAERTDANTIKLYKNGILLETAAEASGNSRVNQDIFICARNTGGAADTFSGREIAFAFIGISLSDAENLTLYNLIQAYMTAIGANV